MAEEPQEESSTETPPSEDINWAVLGTGCLSTVVAGILAAIVIVIVTMALGNSTTAPSPLISISGFAIGLIANTAIGYYTARAAYARNAHVNLHITLVGGVIMVIGAVGLFTNPGTGLNSYQTGMGHALAIASWLLTYPCMLGGASLQAGARR